MFSIALCIFTDAMVTDSDVEKRPGGFGPMYRDKRGWKLALVVTVQSLVVAVCLAVTICVYYKSDDSKDSDIFILFQPIAFTVGTSDSKPAELNIRRNNTVGLRANNHKIYVKYGGPYILHMDICCIGMDSKEGSGTLQLRVASRVLAHFTLKAKEKSCVGLFDTVYLRKDEDASLHYSSEENNLRVTELTLGLNYLLGGMGG